jgi:hypothetical protein
MLGDALGTDPGVLALGEPVVCQAFAGAVGEASATTTRLATVNGDVPHRDGLGTGGTKGWVLLGLGRLEPRASSTTQSRDVRQLLLELVLLERKSVEVVAKLSDASHCVRRDKFPLEKERRFFSYGNFPIDRFVIR